MSEYIVEGSPSEEVTDYLGVKYSVTHFERREEIVRCRDCVHYETDEVCDGCTLFDFADCSGSMADKFCAWGEMAENIIIGESYKQPSENDGEVIKNGGQYKFDGEAHTAVYAPYPLSVKASNPQGEVFVTGTTFEHDTREKLEADIEKLCTGILAHRVEHQKEYCNLHGLQPDKNHSCWSETQWLFPVMLHLLDRQEAITTSELCGDYTYMKADRDLKVREAQELQAKVDELTAERDEWKAKAEQAERAMNRAAGKWAKAESRSAKRAEAVERLRQLPPMDTSGMRYVRAMLGSVAGMTAQDVVAELIELLEDDELTAECEQYRENMLAQTRIVAELTAERDKLQAELKQERLEWESERDYANLCEERLKELTAERDLWIKRYQQAHKYALELTDEKTCRIVAHVTDGLMTGFPKRLFEFSCGHSVMLVGLVEEPNYCSICGAKVVRKPLPEGEEGGKVSDLRTALYDYEHLLREMWRWLDIKQLTREPVTPEDVDMWRERLEREGVKPE